MTTSPDIDILFEDARWTEEIPDAEELAKNAVSAALAIAEHVQGVSLSILLANDDRITTLNRDFRNIDKPTNVLSFPSVKTPFLVGEVPAIGDIALAYDTLSREALLANRPFRNHFQHLIVHASLHLIGYTHDMDKDAEHMEALEVKALKGLGIENPYEESGDRQTAYGTREP